MNKRIALFRNEGRSLRWKSLDKAIKKTLSTRKEAYFNKETEKLKAIGRGSGWYSILNKMNDKPSDDWNITQLEPDKTPKEIATNLAKHFSDITNQTNELVIEEVTSNILNQTTIPQLLQSTVATKLKDYKKPNSVVPGDIPARLTNEKSTSLSIPLTWIYNTCLINTRWPRVWKMETLVAIPKTQTPVSYNDLRPISMSTLWSKVLESFIADFTTTETLDHWKGSQHGGIKGSSTEHVLIGAWDRILCSLESNNNCKGVAMTALDFSKSFSKCTYKEILLAYKDLNASQWLINMHKSFLEERTMVVKVGTEISEPVRITGGAVQGSVLGILDHNAVLESLDDNLLDIYIAKYVDDITLIEAVPKSVATDIDIQTTKPTHTFLPPKSQYALETIAYNATKKNMVINKKKDSIINHLKFLTT